MIPRPRIAYWLSLFGERLGRQLSDATFREYATALDAIELEPEEFERAAALLFASERFLPPALEFLYAARPDSRPERRAALALNAIREARTYRPNDNGGGVTGWTFIAWDKVPADLREVAREAWQLCGGSVDALEVDRDFGLQRRFSSLFTQRDAGRSLGRIAGLEPSRLPLRRAPGGVQTGPVPVGRLLAERSGNV